MIAIDVPTPQKPPTQTVVDMLREVARRAPAREALVCGATRLSWAELDARVNRVANALLARGMGRGDNIAVLSPNSVAYAELFLGILRAGACVTPLSTMASADALEKMLADCDAKAMFLADTYRGLASAFLPR